MRFSFFSPSLSPTKELKYAELFTAATLFLLVAVLIAEYVRNPQDEYYLNNIMGWTLAAPGAGFLSMIHACYRMPRESTPVEILPWPPVRPTVWATHPNVATPDDDIEISNIPDQAMTDCIPGQIIEA